MARQGARSLPERRPPLASRGPHLLPPSVYGPSTGQLWVWLWLKVGLRLWCLLCMLVAVALGLVESGVFL